MAKIEIQSKDYPSVKPKFDELVVGAQYPLQVTLNHNFKPGLVLPIIGVYDTIERGTDHVLTLQSEQQAWDLVGQLAHLAHLHKRDSIATISTGSEAQAEAPAGAEAPAPESEAQPAEKPAAPAASNKRNAGKDEVKV